MSKASRIGRKLEWLRHKETELSKQKPPPDEEIRSIREERSKLRKLLDEALDDYEPGEDDAD